MLGPILFTAALAACCFLARRAALNDEGDIPGPPTFRDVEITKFHGGEYGRE